MVPLVNGKKEVWRKQLKPITFTIGPVPVVLVPSLAVEIGIDGKVEAKLTTSVTQTASYTAGIDYRNQQWTPVASDTMSFGYQPPNFSGRLDAKVFAAAPISLKLYGVVGPETAPELYLQITGGPERDPWWKLYAGFRARVGAKIDLIAVRIESPTFELIDVSRLLAQAEGPFITPTFTFTPTPTPSATSTPTPTPTLTTVPSIGRGTVMLISASYDGAPWTGGSGNSSISADGRYIAFMSDSSRIVANDINRMRDVFVHDREISQTTLVSVTPDGNQASGVGAASMSTSGRYIVFTSYDARFVENDSSKDIVAVVYDRETSQVRTIAAESDRGRSIHGTQGVPLISSNGRYVIFSSGASFLGDDDTNLVFDIFLHDYETDRITRVSVALDGMQANGHSYIRSISDDGRYVAFDSYASNLVVNDSNDSIDSFVHDRQTGQTKRVSVASDGTQANSHSWMEATGSISADGRYVIFNSNATNLTNSYNGQSQVFVHDITTAQTTRVSTTIDDEPANGASFAGTLSADGRYVAFASSATNLVANDELGGGGTHVYLYNRETGRMRLVTNSIDGAPANGSSVPSSISADGRYLTFGSFASNLVDNDLNDSLNFQDVFVYDRDGE